MSQSSIVNANVWKQQGLVSMSQCFTSPNYWGYFISNSSLKVMWNKSPKTDIYQPLTNHWLLTIYCGHPSHSLPLGLSNMFNHQFTITEMSPSWTRKPSIVLKKTTWFCYCSKSIDTIYNGFYNHLLLTGISSRWPWMNFCWSLYHPISKSWLVEIGIHRILFTKSPV